MTRFAAFMVVLLVVSAPLFYLIVTDFYAEDLREAAEAAGLTQEELDLEEDTTIGLVFQLLAVVGIFAASIFLVMRLVPGKLWRPFYRTLDALSNFRVESGEIPAFEPCTTREFARLNDTLTRILRQSVSSYQVQKQFTENASHELQTPLAIVQGKLDLLLQDPDLTDRQAQLLEDIYHEVRHTSRLSRNLLLLARIENAQYRKGSAVCLQDKLQQLLPSLQLLAEDITIRTEGIEKSESSESSDIVPLTLSCNEVLLEAMLNNLVVNAVRHNCAGGEILLVLRGDALEVSNTSDEPALDADRIFDRFHQSGSERKGNGLGLAIVRSICRYHGWTISYRYADGRHVFCVKFL